MTACRGGGVGDPKAYGAPPLPNLLTAARSEKISETQKGLLWLTAELSLALQCIEHLAECLTCGKSPIICLRYKIGQLPT